MNKIKLPIPADVTRCLAHGSKVGEWCQHNETCARHITIRHDSAETNKTSDVRYTVCSDERYMLYMPINGMPTLGGRE